ncbi:MAG: cytochrome c [Reichenbachiella sp.]|uniref:c-type cytochrome n=1 Tax=Reichenbachiella sp. TaxID=2184521 RepID=UPI002966D479|nr:cytochrome c [Reichenbachiella sp.]MDW3210003.1 cytochrome c [Reichenbachiella sp.]
MGITTSGQSLKESMARGKQIYKNECIACHMENGEGLTGAFPPLANSDYFKEDISKAVDVILNGLEGEVVVNGVTYFGVMDPVPLSDQEVADVLNYIRNSWGGKEKELTLVDIQKMK